MNNLIITFNLELPLGSKSVLRDQPGTQQAGRVHLFNANEIPAELLYATACSEVGCDCGSRLSHN